MISRIARCFPAYKRDERGSTAIMFSLSLVALLMAGGAAVDIGRSVHSRGQLQVAADAGILAAVRAKQLDQTISSGKMTSIARQYFDQNFDAKSKITVKGFKIVEKDGQFTLDVDARLKATIMGVAGIKNLDVGVESSADVAPGMPLEVALVLDNTGSMSGTKLTTLKMAANKMAVDLLKPENKKVKMGIVPFSDYVNVGLPNRNKQWIDVPADSTTTEHQCWNTYPDKVKSNCRTETKTGYNDGVPYTYTTEVCDTDWGDPVEECGNKTVTKTWNGCVGSRDYPDNVGDDNYKLNKVPGMMNTWCTAPITALTNDKSVIQSQIDAMNATGNTYIPAGLAWGWRILTPHQPYVGAKSKGQMKSEGGMKAVVLMTDGANTRSPQYPDHWGSDATLANTLTEELCTNIKNENIFVYTVAFAVTDATIKTLLQGCASGNDYYFDASDPAALAKAFDTIAGRLSMLRLTK